MAKKDYLEKVCEYQPCGVMFKPTRGDQRFHAPGCRKAYFREEFVRVLRDDLRQETAVIDGLMNYAAEFQGADLPYHNRLKAALKA